MDQGINSRKLFYVISSFILLVLIIFTVKVNYAISKGVGGESSLLASAAAEASKSEAPAGPAPVEKAAAQAAEKTVPAEAAAAPAVVGKESSGGAGDPIDGVINSRGWKKLPGKYRIEIDKAGYKLFLFKGDRLLKTYGVAIGRNPDGADKQKKGDLRTPEGNFYVQSIEKSDKWLHNGTFAYGPWFLRLKTPWQGIAIHGTDEPKSIGTKASEGCVRMHSEEVTELKNAVEEQVSKSRSNKEYRLAVDIFADREKAKVAGK